MKKLFDFRLKHDGVKITDAKHKSIDEIEEEIKKAKIKFR